MSLTYSMFTYDDLNNKRKHRSFYIIIFQEMRSKQYKLLGNRHFVMLTESSMDCKNKAVFKYLLSSSKLGRLYKHITGYYKKV